ncbi:methyltransferase domain-containing protein [Nonomuraea endophytica]|uniref:methyltransferase domain-containing protein n=1 Tax=Nonomuraea endophytica TaxID=714136 RepID=UPI0037CB1D3E
MAGTRDCYEEAARSVAAGKLSCCAPCAPEYFGAAAYPPEQLAGLPQAVIDSAMGCGHPVGAAGLSAGDVVVDLGCGTGIDVLLAARQVGRSGRAVGVDMTPGLVELARGYARQAGTGNVTFHCARIEQLPLPDRCADVVLANGTLSLSPDKPAALTQAARVLRPGGRLTLTDFILRDGLDAEQRRVAGEQSGCVTGTLAAAEYLEHLVEAGFAHPEVRLDHRIAPGMYLGLVTAERAHQPRPLP